MSCQKYLRRISSGFWESGRAMVGVLPQAHQKKKKKKKKKKRGGDPVGSDQYMGE